jgi:hypothetical protein
VPVAALQTVDLTNAKKRDARSYDVNTVLVFNRNVRGFKVGESTLGVLNKLNVRSRRLDQVSLNAIGTFAHYGSRATR